ncbi:arginase family protein [Candidatus Thorarchaeota archaeon]|nr:MAG: arginase family protein [Candidatus Thorarchaeota archaeon]
MSLRDDLNGYLRLPRAFFGLRPPKEGEPDVGIVGVPYDITSSYIPGTRFGPDAIRQSTDSERSHSYPLSIGNKPILKEPLSKLLTLEDVGDLEVSLRMPDAAAIDITEASTKLGKRNCKLLFLGGDHFITYPILKGLVRAKKGRWGLVYLDAHADLYSDMGGYQLSHATTVRRIIDEKIVNTEDIIAYDIRSALPEHKTELMIEQKTSISDNLSDLDDRVDHIYISIDLDVLDPPLVPGVSHPESAGLSMIQLVNILRAAFATGKVHHTDLVELNPLIDKDGITAIVARDLVKEILTGYALS